MSDPPARVGLALVLFSLVFSGPVSATRETVREAGAQEVAEAHYQRGLAAYRGGRFQEAIEEFLAAEQKVPSPRLAFNVALAYEHLNRPARALQYFRDYLRRGPDPSNAVQIEHRVAELASLLGEQGIQQVTVHSDPTGAIVTIDGVARGSTPWTGELALGSHRVSAQREGYLDRELVIELGESRALDVELPLLPQVGQQEAEPQQTVLVEPRLPGDDETDLGILPWALVGGGGAALVGAGVFELLRRDAQGDARDATYQLDWVEARDSAQSYQTTARVLAGVGGLLAIGGGVLLWVDSEGRAETPPVAFGCDTETCLGTWRGSF
jgi:tetratricopeptide (TPR) repeat protein